jgi:hypothetical protein
MQQVKGSYGMTARGKFNVSQPSQKEVKGKSSIRTLIKSAATRED